MTPKRLLEIIVATCALLASCLVQCAAQDHASLDISRDAYHARFRIDLGVPEWVKWSVAKSDFGKTKRSQVTHFRTDPATPKPRVKPSMYSRSGYQRGHMCPAADRSISKDLMRQTFYMSNICPMTPALNTGKWKQTEVLERCLTKRYPQVDIIAGALFFPRDTAWIGNGRVAVPHAFVKVITIPGNPAFYKIFILENLWHYQEE